LKENAASAADFATALAKDKKFRKQLLSAMGHGAVAQKRTARKIALIATAGRLTHDPKLKREVRKMTQSLEKAWSRVERKRSHKLRNSLFIVAGVGVGGAAVAVLKSRKGAMSSVPFTGGTSPRTIDESIEVNVPVSTAYNQWTQFEDFPLFMEGVDHVQQLDDDTRLHWVATVAGKTAEWNSKILEQHPTGRSAGSAKTARRPRHGHVRADRRIEDADPSVDELSGEGLKEALGSAAGLDQRRVRGDLDRFKELIESRGAESGAWRGEVFGGDD